jgi:fibronectin type 3 domain-containing protein
MTRMTICQPRHGLPRSKRVCFKPREFTPRSNSWEDSCKAPFLREVVASGRHKQQPDASDKPECTRGSQFQRCRNRGLKCWRGFRGLLLLGSCLCLSSLAWGGMNATVSWNANAESDVVGYKVYYGNASRSYGPGVDAGGGTSLKITNLVEGQLYYFAVTAYTAAGLESDFSNEVSYWVPATNQAPTISSIANQQTPANTQLRVSFTIGDSETPADTLQVEAVPSNPSLLASLTFSGTGSNRDLILQPAANQTGSSDITLSVSDGALSTSTTFSLVVSLTNTPPIISSITNQTLNEDSPSPPIPFIVADAETPATKLVVFAKSSNPIVVPSSGIIISGSGSNRTVKLVPATNQTGTSIITLGVVDGLVTNQTAFQVVVNPVNDPPFISTIAAQNVNQGSATPLLTFTVGDVETPASSLVLSRASSNPTLVPVSAIVFGGSGSNRTVKVTPATNQTGTATITLGVSDGSQTTTSSFALTVSSGNHAPTISSITNISIPKNGSSGPIAFVIGDAETPANGLSLAAGSSNPYLIANSGIVLGGSASNRTVTITPVQGRSGTATIVLQVSDGSLTASNSFGVIVGTGNSVPPPDTQLLAADVSGTSLLISWGSTAGGVYQLLYKADLSKPVWTPLSSNITAIDTVTSYTDSITNSASRVYRVEKLQ